LTVTATPVDGQWVKSGSATQSASYSNDYSFSGSGAYDGGTITGSA
jgi:hypothetical protein